jgi:cytochrome c556
MSGAAARFDSRNHADSGARPVRGNAAARLLPSVLLLLLPLPLLSGSLAHAQSAPRPEALIKWRQSAFQVVAWNTQRLKTALATDTADAREVQAAASALAAIATAGLPELFAPGTEHGKGWRDTTAASAAFTDNARFRAQSEQFARETALLARVAAGADRAAIREQFGKVAKTCKGCHDKFRATD